jgi:hypothetical protein
VFVPLPLPFSASGDLPPDIFRATVPLIPQPNHPAYVSNAAIIASLVTEFVGFMSSQQTAQWRYLGEEAGFSRIYAGIHYPRDVRGGNQMGKSIGALAIQRDRLNGT